MGRVVALSGGAAATRGGCLLLLQGAAVAGGRTQQQPAGRFLVAACGMVISSGITAVPRVSTVGLKKC